PTLPGSAPTGERFVLERTSSQSENGHRRKNGHKPQPRARVRRRQRRGEIARLLAALQAVEQGDFSTRLPSDMGEVATAFNRVVERNHALTVQLVQVAEQVGQKGEVSARLSIDNARGGWASSVTAVNSLIGELV